MTESTPVDLLHFCASGSLEKGWAGGIDTYIISIAQKLDGARYKLRAVTTLDEFFTSLCRKNQIPCAVVPYRRTRDVHWPLLMARYLRQNPPDILHVHGLFLGSFYCMVAAKLAGIRRIVLTVHTFSEDNVQVGPYGPLFDLADAYSIRAADIVHCIAQYQTRNKMMRFARRIREVPVGLDVEQVKAEYPERIRTEFGIPQEAVLISCAGRLHFTKGFSYLLDALGMLSQRGLDLYCLIAGEGPERAELELKIMRLGLEDRVFLAGWRSDVHQIIGAGDIFCLPSLAEGMPKVTEEAMALSKPIVASAVFGVPEQVADGVNGLLTAAGNPRSLATALERYATNAELRRSHGEAGRRLVLDRFNLDRMVSGINGIYEELLGGSPRPGV